MITRADDWTTSMLDTSLSDDEGELAIPLHPGSFPLLRSDDPASRASTYVGPPQITAENDEEAQYFAENELLDIGAIEEACVFSDNPFTIARITGKQKKVAVSNEDTMDPAGSSFQNALPAPTVKPKLPKSNPLLEGFKRQQEKAHANKLKPKKSRNKNKKVPNQVDKLPSDTPIFKEDANANAPDNTTGRVNASLKPLQHRTNSQKHCYAMKYREKDHVDTNSSSIMEQQPMQYPIHVVHHDAISLMTLPVAPAVPGTPHSDKTIQEGQCAIQAVFS